MSITMFTVKNQAMLPVLRIRQVVQLDTSAYISGPLSRGDVVVYRSPKYNELLLACRVVGLPGERIELRLSKLFINGVEHAEPYVEHDSARKAHSRNHGPATIPMGDAFLMGDFRDLSEDSRSIGTISLSRIVGRIRLPA